MTQWITYFQTLAAPVCDEVVLCQTICIGSHLRWNICFEDVEKYKEGQITLMHLHNFRNVGVCSEHWWQAEWSLAYLVPCLFSPEVPKEKFKTLIPVWDTLHIPNRVTDPFPADMIHCRCSSRCFFFVPLTSPAFGWPLSKLFSDVILPSNSKWPHFLPESATFHNCQLVFYVQPWMKYGFVRCYVNVDSGPVVEMGLLFQHH